MASRLGEDFTVHVYGVRYCHNSFYVSKQNGFVVVIALYRACYICGEIMPVPVSYNHGFGQGVVGGFSQRDDWFLRDNSFKPDPAGDCDDSLTMFDNIIGGHIRVGEADVWNIT